jgi:hypothetical protein
MVFGTPQRKELSLPPSTWIDVPAVEASGHWIPEQGKVAWELLDSLAADGVDLREVFVITPFRAVADRLRPSSTSSPMCAPVRSTPPRARKPTSSFSCSAAIPSSLVPDSGRPSIPTF